MTSKSSETSSRFAAFSFALLEIVTCYILGQLIGAFIIDGLNSWGVSSLLNTLISFKQMATLPLMAIASLSSLFMLWFRYPILVSTAALTFAAILCHKNHTTRVVASLAMGSLGMLALASIGH